MLVYHVNDRGAHLHPFETDAGYTAWLISGVKSTATRECFQEVVLSYRFLRLLALPFRISAVKPCHHVMYM